MDCSSALSSESIMNHWQCFPSNMQHKEDFITLWQHLICSLAVVISNISQNVKEYKLEGTDHRDHLVQITLNWELGKTKWELGHLSFHWRPKFSENIEESFSSITNLCSFLFMLHTTWKRTSFPDGGEFSREENEEESGQMASVKVC